MRTKKYKKFPLLTLAGVLIAAHAGAAESDKTIDLGKMIVTATRTEKKVEDAPGSVTLIDQEELKKQNIQTVDEALNSLAGVFAKRTKGLMDATPSVSFRGFKGDQYTLILLDGQPLNDAYGGVVEWGTMPVNNIDHIEVVRGAASALYGGNAMGGVINIITKTPEKLELEAGAGFGSNNTRRYAISAGNRFGDRLSVSLGYEEESTDGYVTTPVLSSISAGAGTDSGGYPMDDSSGNPTKWVVGDKGDNGALHRNLNGKVSLDFSDTGMVSITAGSGRHEYDYGPPNTYMGTFGDDTTYADAGSGQRARFRPNDFISYTGIGRNDTDNFSITAKEMFGPVELHGQLGTVQSDDRYTLETGSGSADYYNSAGSLKITENESWFGEASGNLPLGDAHLLTLGTSYRTDKSDTNDYSVPYYRSYDGQGASTFYSGGKAAAWALFVQDEWQILDPLSLYIGARYDSWKVSDGASGVPGAETTYESNTESAFSPKIAALWKLPTETTLRASVGRAFRTPTLYELYRSWVSGSTTYESNPSLKPETVWSYELGCDQYLFDRKTRLSLTGYRNDIDDLIYYQINGSTKTRTNAGKARTYGLELEASHKVADWLTLWGNFTYTDARIIENPTDPTSEDKRISGIPRTTWNIGLDSRYRWVKGSLVGRYYSKLDDDTVDGVYGTYEPALFFDAKVTLSPWQWTELSLSVENLLDEEYFEYYKTDGRTFFAELTVRY
jgi:iron complex outermembrane receptor protein